jgi:hypothetical protein
VWDNKILYSIAPGINRLKHVGEAWEDRELAEDVKEGLLQDMVNVITPLSPLEERHEHC